MRSRLNGRRPIRRLAEQVAWCGWQGGMPHAVWFVVRSAGRAVGRGCGYGARGSANSAARDAARGAARDAARLVKVLCDA